MAKDKSKAANPSPPPANNVIQLPQKCPVEGCSKKPQRSVFCQEHFAWFKEGLINRQGEMPKDFDKKYQTYMRKHKAA